MVDAELPPPAEVRLALVLGGGGPAGIAWQAGLLAGLAEGGLDLAGADYILGTSAGAFVGAQLAMGRRAADLTGAILAEAERPQPGPASIPAAVLVKMHEAALGRRDPLEVRRELGAIALAADTLDEESFIGQLGRSLSKAPWPERAFACTAVDADTGELVVWDEQSRVELARAVASSCAVPGLFPPITIKGRRYIDGGMRSGTNADLARGYQSVVVIALRLAPQEAATGLAMQAQLEGELAALRQGGGRVELILPVSTQAWERNLLDNSRRPDAARSGLAQGAGLARAWKGGGPDAWR